MTRKNQSYIQYLDLSYAHEYVTDRCFINNKDEFLLKYMTNLKYINLSKCTRLSPTVIFLLVKHNAHGLHTLVLASCKISNDVLKWIGQANQHQLKFLNLENTMIRPCKAIDTSNHLESMLVDNSRNTAQLRYINLSFCTWVSSQTIENIARGLPKLEYVVLQWCNQIKLRTIIMMAKQLQFLNTIDVQHIDTIHDRKQLVRLFRSREGKATVDAQKGAQMIMSNIVDCQPFVLQKDMLMQHNLCRRRDSLRVKKKVMLLSLTNDCTCNSIN
ncbi:MAG: hypothetical protein EXX96DRAFT_537020 [Benjaminiella poitrasii]|nr:MAG: hypothetical protein EXX96DRAFT_537020 [Benjaminiella poitrasii]